MRGDRRLQKRQKFEYVYRLFIPPRIEAKDYTYLTTLYLLAATVHK